MATVSDIVSLSTVDGTVYPVTVGNPTTPPPPQAAVSGWGEGWVHPVDGDDGNDGTTPQTPKATIAAAINSGLRVIHVAAGDHDWTGTGANATLLFHPGVHTFTNAPVVCSQTMTLAGLAPPPQHTDQTDGAAVVKGNNTTDIFRFVPSNNTSQRWGVVVRNLKFDASTFTRSAIYSVNLNMADIDGNVLYTSANWEPDTYLYYSEQSTPTPPPADSSWTRITRNTVIGAALTHIDQGWSWVNRHVISSNRGYSRGGANATNPFVTLTGRHTGHAVVNNSFEGMIGGNAAIFVSGPASALYVAGNSFERIVSGVAIRLGQAAGDVANSIIMQSVGHTSASGDLRVNGVVYKTAVNVTDDAKNQIVVAGRHNNV